MVKSWFGGNAGPSGLARCAGSMRARFAGPGREMRIETTPQYTRFGFTTNQQQVATALRDVARLLQVSSFTEDHLNQVREQLARTDALAAQDPEAVTDRTLDRVFYHDSFARWPVEGNPQLRERISVEELRAFQLAHYTQPNVIVVVSGNVFAESVRDLVEDAFSGLPLSGFSAPDMQQALRPLVSNPSSQFRQVPGLTSTHLTMVWRTVPLGHPDHAALDCLATYLNSPLSPLRKILAVDQLADQLQVEHRSAVGRDGMLRISLRVRGDNMPAVRQVCNDVIVLLKENLVSDEDLESAKRGLLLQYAQRNLVMDDLAERFGPLGISYRACAGKSFISGFLQVRPRRMCKK